MDNISLEKQHAAIAATLLIKNGMTVGLGTGSTVTFFLNALAKRIRRENLSITGVTTSFKTEIIAQNLGIKIVDIDDVATIDLTIDGADEVDYDMNGITGGGAAFLMEKIVANNSKRIVWIVDSQKVHLKLGLMPLPLEVVPFGSDKLMTELTKQHLYPTWRKKDGKLLVTDMGHYIVDLSLKTIDQPYELARYLDGKIGIVEHGLFLDIADEIIIGTTTGVEYLFRSDLQK
ncbi:ribose-5-phosphate isomerase RpiA [Leuconostoc gelidum]|uniref:ribose-5-phosphate isomerase RpiA n=1 Tax=Leuconostoc gelidum TaxID=1244 RepID=UPI000219279A|nr:ribose-5-phosphate isomerase RpiA [Leuconostoc gelidum]GMA67965.1 ribose-5-phosphate isomerase A [Leuconostoc gelidum subsp. gelidum]